MNQNHIAPSAFAHETAADEPASPFHSSRMAAARPEPADFEFATEAEANAYWAGVSDGLRNGGNIPAPRLAAHARDAYPELVATAEQLRDRDIIDFDPVSLRHRIDGWTPEKQREYVEALADSGVARYAAGRVGMSEQSAARLRRRADARAFDRACDAAMRIGARRLISVAYERAIEGTIKRHFYHGEVKSEERVYDNRLLIALIGKLGPLVAPPDEPDPVAENWQPWMEAIEQGLTEPTAPVSSEPEAAPDDQPEWGEDGLYRDADGLIDDIDVWEEDGDWRTSFPPPPHFDGYQHGAFGSPDYRRSLTEAEQAAIDADEAMRHADRIARESARRDCYFTYLRGEFFSAREPELYETSAEPPESSEAIIP